MELGFTDFNGQPYYTLEPGTSGAPASAGGQSGVPVESAAPVASQPMVLTPVDYQPDFRVQPASAPQAQPSPHASTPQAPSPAPMHWYDYPARIAEAVGHEFLGTPMWDREGHKLPDHQGWLQSAVENVGDVLTGQPAPMVPAAAHAAMAPVKNLVDLSSLPEYMQSDPAVRDAEARAGIQTAAEIAGGASPFAEEGAAGVFGGKLAHGADLQALRRAKQMAADGHDVRDIWQQTGWAQGPEGEWRFEIPDQPAKFIDPEVLDNEARFRARALLKRIDHLSRHPGANPEVSAAEVDQLTKEGQALENRLRGHFTLGDLLDHPKLYEAYPWLREVPVEARDFAGPQGEGWRAVWDPTVGDNGGIKLNLRNQGGNKLSALHEVQHAVQDQEGFAPGASLKHPQVVEQADKEVGPELRKLKREHKELTAKRDAYVFRKLHERYPERSPATLKKFIKAEPIEVRHLQNDYWRENPDDIHKANTLHSRSMALAIKHRNALIKAYRNAAGEVESKNVEGRAGLLPESAARVHPDETATTVNGEQPVVLNRPQLRKAQMTPAEEAARDMILAGKASAGLLAAGIITPELVQYLQDKQSELDQQAPEGSVAPAAQQG